MLRRIRGPPDREEFWGLLSFGGFLTAMLKILSGCPVEKDPEGLPYWEGFSRPAV